MSTAKARQEARRKKILENADKRMQILTNQYEKSEDSSLVDDSGNAIKEDVLKARLNSKDNGQEETSKSKTLEDAKSQEGKVVDENQTPQDNAKKDESISSKQEETFRSDLRHRGTVKIQKTSEPMRTEPTIDPKSVQSENSDSDDSFGFKQLEGLKMASLVLLALVCRLVLNCGIGVMYFQSIFLPFTAAEVSWIHYQMKNSLHTPRKRNMMSTVLMLCGIKKDLLLVYDGIMNQVTTVSEDFALFVFSFFLSNCVIS